MEGSVVLENVEMTNEVNLEVLHPENPLMIRFQKTLKQQLENKLEKICDIIAQNESEIKKLRSESDSVSEILFTQKSEVDKMEKTLDECNKTITNLLAAKEHVRNESKDLKKAHSDEMALYRDENKLNNEFRRKVDVQRHVLKELQNYDRTRVSSLLIKRNSVMKNKSDKDAKLREKDKLDYLVMRIETEIFKFQLLIREHEKQLKIKCEERSVLKEKLAAKNSEFSSLSEENSRLLNVWKNVVLLVSNRDEKCSVLKSEFENHEIVHKTKIAKLSSYKRDANQEMFRNVTIVTTKNKKQTILDQLKRDYGNDLKTKKMTEDELLQTCDMIESTKKSMNLSLEEHALHKHSLSVIEVRLKNFSLKKTELDERILSQLHNKLLSSNVSSKLNDEIRKLRDATMQQEIIVQELQTNYVTKFSYLDKQKLLLVADHELLRNIKKEIDESNKNISVGEEKLNKLKLLIGQQHYKLHLEEGRLRDLEKQPVQDTNLPARLESLSKSIQEINEAIESDKRIWIRKQNETMMMIETKSKLINELNSLQSHFYILSQKSLRLNQNIIKEEKENSNLDKIISQVLRKIALLNTECSNQKESEILMDSKTCNVQSAVLEKLKTAETDSMQLVSEIAKLVEKQENLGKELLENEREYSEWQKKFQQAQEMKENITKEMSENGDVGAMKNEIHRMEIRYAQLKRAQDSLVSDLESSVHKRDRIVDAALMKERTLGDEVSNKNQRVMIQKIEMIGNKNKTLQKKIEDYQNLFTTSCADQCRILSEVNECEASVNKMQNSLQELESKMLEYVALKQKNLEILIRRQRLADFLWRLKTDKLKYSLPSEFVIEKIFSKHRFMQDDLNEVLDTLSKDFPTLTIHIIRIINVLNSLSF